MMREDASWCRHGRRRDRSRIIGDVLMWSTRSNTVPVNALRVILPLLDIPLQDQEENYGKFYLEIEHEEL